MVLKICTYSHTTWVSDVEEVMLMRSFEVPSGVDIDICSLAYQEADGVHVPPMPRSGIHVAEFHASDKSGCLVSVTRQRRDLDCDWMQHWIVPHNSTFLMERGETVDRI